MSIGNPNSPAYPLFKRAVRSATENDLSILTTIRNDATAYKLSRKDLAWGRNEWTLEAARQALEQGGLHVIEQNGMPAGMLSLSWQDDEHWGRQAPNAGYVHGLSIRDGFRGLGLGVYAINWCADVVRANDRQRLRLDCEVTNTSLCNYYESLGFARVGTKPFPSGYVASLYELTIY
ncbi:GNAT family N-acetyltransferase [Bordetella genomosp. 9]|uniref:GNAT family N-acetyltransferase n=1 Tax=Bordetella genomosp. 9 TaxID=1416803 RepID=UPI001E32CFED|nr:GNAT family N-acetyltransferase [Bordetella genomosp. 9]